MKYTLYFTVREVTRVSTATDELIRSLPTQFACSLFATPLYKSHPAYAATSF